MASNSHARFGVVLCLLSMFTSLSAARFQPVQLPSQKGTQRFWLLPDNSIIRGAPPGLELAITVANTNRTMGVRAFCATLPLAMANMSAYPLDDSIPSFDLTISTRALSSQERIIDPFTTGISVRKTTYGQQLPFDLTRRDILNFLGGLSWWISFTAELESLESFREVLFDMWLFDPKEEFRTRTAKLVAKGRFERLLLRRGEGGWEAVRDS